MSALTTYTHLLSFYTWFNEGSIQSLLNAEYNGNLTNEEILSRTTVDRLTILANILKTDIEYMFDKPDVSSSLVRPVEGTVHVAATYPGIGKNIIQTTVGSQPVIDTFKFQAWNAEHETGLFTNTFDFENKPYIGIVVSLLDVNIVIVIETEKDNSAPPVIPDPTPPPPPERGTCEIPGVPICCEHDEEPVTNPSCTVEFTPAH